jgi:hypothetical protein
MEPIKAYFTAEGWKRDLKQTKSDFKAFGKRLYDSFTNAEATARFNEHKQASLDLMARIESPEYQAQFAGVREAVNRRAREQHFLALGRPDLAYPHIYATAPTQPLEIKLNDVNSFYRLR